MEHLLKPKNKYTSIIIAAVVSVYKAFDLLITQQNLWNYTALSTACILPAGKGPENGTEQHGDKADDEDKQEDHPASGDDSGG